MGLFESVKLPLAPFAYAFCPVGMVSKMALSVDFFSKAFGFYNWYLSTLFPFASFFLVFARQAHFDSYTGANVAVLGAHLLHEPTVLDQAFETRRLLAEALCAQYFGVRVHAAAAEDAWLLAAIQAYLSALLLRVFHGKNDYKYGLRRDLERALELEAAGRPALFSTRHGRDLETRDWLRAKGRVVLAMLERRLERSNLQRVFMHLWSEACEGRLPGGALTTRAFLRSAKKMTGRDPGTFAEQWIYGTGAPVFNCSFVYNRKRSTLEVELKQTTIGQPSKRWTGSLLIRVHEQEGVFDHSVHVDDHVQRFELPYHTKIRKARKKRRAPGAAPEDAGSGGEEAAARQEDGDAEPEAEALLLPITSETSPVAWIRLDPDLDWFAGRHVEQPDFMWAEQLEHDRDVAGQREAAQHLSSYPSEQAIDAYERTLLAGKTFHRVRVDAARGLAACGADLGLPRLLAAFGRRFGVERSGGRHPLPKPNRFGDNLASYLVQCGLVEAVGMVRDEEGRAPTQAIAFLASLLRHNDNAQNGGVDDSHYLATCIAALSQAMAQAPALPEGTRTIVHEELLRYVQREHILPSFRCLVLSAALCAWPAILATAAGPEAVDELFFSRLSSYLDPGHAWTARVAAAKGLLSSALARGSFPAAIEHLSGLLSPAGEQRPFHLRLLDALPAFKEAITALPEASRDVLWTGLSASQDSNVSRRVLDTLASLFRPAGGDELVETAVGPVSGAPISAGPMAPVSRHELGASDQEDEDEVAMAGAAPQEADWMSELAGEARPIVRIRPLQRPATHTAAPSSGPAGQMAAVLQQLWDNYDSIPFRYPVDPSVPGYYLVIRQPMDLSTAQARLREGRYGANLAALCADLRLIFDNCFIFNQPDSLIYDQALRLRKFAYKTLKRAFPEHARTTKRQLLGGTPADQVAEQIAETVAAVPEEPATTAPVQLPRLKISLAAPPPPTLPAPSIVIPKAIVLSASPSKPRQPVPSAPERMDRLLARLESHQHAYWFAQPVDPEALGIPHYREVIAEPMDFSTIRARLDDGHYDGEPAEFKRHVLLVFANAKTFNPPSTLVHQHAVELERLFTRQWPRELDPAPAASSPEPIKIRLNVHSHFQQQQQESPAWQAAARRVLDAILTDDSALPFLQPVDPVAQGCPTYYDEITHPMDLATMRSKLDGHQYQSAGAMAEDMRLIAKNAAKFNGRASVIAKMAAALQSHFSTLMHEHGLA